MLWKVFFIHFWAPRAKHTTIECALTVKPVELWHHFQNTEVVWKLITEKKISVTQPDLHNTKHFLNRNRAGKEKPYSKNNKIWSTLTFCTMPLPAHSESAIKNMLSVVFECPSLSIKVAVRSSRESQKNTCSSPNMILNRFRQLKTQVILQVHPRTGACSNAFHVHRVPTMIFPINKLFKQL